MSEIVKTKKGKTSKGMPLDTALGIIEEADAALREARPTHKAVSEEMTLTKNDVSAATCNKIGFSTLAGGAAGIAAGMSGILEGGPFLFLAPMLTGFVLLSATTTGLNFMDKILSPKKYRQYIQQTTEGSLFRQLDIEAFHAKEKETLTKVAPALKAANKILKEQGQEIFYTTQEGFNIRSQVPVLPSKWDTIRVEAARQQGVKTLGIGTKPIKELVS